MGRAGAGCWWVHMRRTGGGCWWAHMGRTGQQGAHGAHGGGVLVVGSEIPYFHRGADILLPGKSGICSYGGYGVAMGASGCWWWDLRFHISHRGADILLPGKSGICSYDGYGVAMGASGGGTERSAAPTPA